MKYSNFKSKWYFRILKVFYVLVYFVGFLFISVGAYSIGVDIDDHIDRNKSHIVCETGKDIKMQNLPNYIPVGLSVYYDKLYIHELNFRCRTDKDFSEYVVTKESFEKLVDDYMAAHTLNIVKSRAWREGLARNYIAEGLVKRGYKIEGYSDTDMHELINKADFEKEFATIVGYNYFTYYLEILGVVVFYSILFIIFIEIIKRTLIYIVTGYFFKYKND